MTHETPPDAPLGEKQASEENSVRSFAEFNLLPEVRQAIEEMGFLEPTEVQNRTFRQIMEGKDLLVQSRTGTGKTAAFAIPFAQGLLDPSERCTQALCLCPTRELALQVADECTRIMSRRGLQVTPVYGGAPIGRQREALEAGPQLVAGTPGRVLDHLRRGTLKLDALKVLVLDECDEMLSMGFLEDISDIIRRCPSERQTMLFSATIPDDIDRLSRKYMRDPEKITLSADFVSVLEIRHAYYLVSGMGRTRDLTRVLEVERPDSAIVFCNTREETSIVAEHLRREGLDAEAISSDLSQPERERVMGRMRAKSLKYLVATDIAARGIDISDLSHVINFTFPEAAEVYVHRTGRTGRAGKSGVAVSLISPRELGNFYYLKLTYKIRPEERSLPSEEELMSRREGERLERLMRDLAEDKPVDEWRALARRTWASDDGERLVAALLERFFRGGATVETPVKTAPAPSASPRSRSERRSSGRTKERGPSMGEPRRSRRESGNKPGARLEANEGREFWEAWADERGSKTEGGADKAQMRLFLSLGRRDGVSAVDVEKLLADKGLTARSVELHTSHSYVTVGADQMDAFVAALHGQQVGERQLVCEPARRRSS